MNSVCWRREDSPETADVDRFRRFGFSRAWLNRSLFVAPISSAVSSLPPALPSDDISFGVLGTVLCASVVCVSRVGPTVCRALSGCQAVARHVRGAGFLVGSWRRNDIVRRVPHAMHALCIHHESGSAWREKYVWY